MAEETAVPVATDVSNTVDESTRPADAAEPATAVENKSSAGDDVPGDAPVEEQAPEAAAAADEQAAKDDATDAKPDAMAVDGSEEPTSTNGVPASAKKANNNRRKSTGGVPEHKSKKTPKKGKKAIELHLDTKPGDMWLVAMRGYQPWPVIICDEDMLPETLLAKRPVSAIRIDGTYREDYLEGGKNAKDRRYPVMFLGTNEFAWQPNVDLLPFDVEEIKKEVESGSSAKKSKALMEAYAVAAEGHDLAHFKELLANHEEAVQQDELAKEAKQQEKVEKAKKTAKRKSVAAAEPDDVEMEDADDNATASAKKAKPSKKRKKEAGSEGEEEKPAKTPKTTLKLTTKKKPAAEPKKSKASKKEAEAQAEEPVLSEAEQFQKRENLVLYLRHRLQKGFLIQDKDKPSEPPTFLVAKEEDMPALSGYITQLEAIQVLEADIMKKTKVHKVLKKIQKLSTIPRDEEFKIAHRAGELLAKWGPADKPSAPATNGVQASVKTDGEEPAPEAAKSIDADGDATMADSTSEAKDEKPAVAAEHANETVEAAA